ncbi:MAG: MCP four helix bundle domain-containing protein, partial [Methylococcaceae bacterium]
MFKNLTVKTRLFSLIAFLIIMMIAIGIIGLKGMTDSNDTLLTVYQDRTIPLDQLAEVTDLNADSIIQLHLSGMYDPRLAESNLHSIPIAKHLEQIEKNNQQSAKIWAAYMTTYLTPEEKILASDYAKLIDDFIKEKQIALDLYTQKSFTEGNS